MVEKETGNPLKTTVILDPVSMQLQTLRDEIIYTCLATDRESLSFVPGLNPVKFQEPHNLKENSIHKHRNTEKWVHE